MKTLSDLRNAILNNLDEAGDTSTTKTLTDQFLLQAHRLRVSQNTYPFMKWPKVETLTLVIGQRDYTLHQEFHRPIYFWNSTKSNYLNAPSSRGLHNYNPQPVDRTGVQSYTLGNRSQVAGQPTAASSLAVTSTSSSDNTTAKALTIRGMTATGLVTESVTPSGLSTVSTVNSFVNPILSITKGAAWAGTMTITSNSGAVTILTLDPAEMGRSYQTLRLMELPDSADTVYYEFYRLPSPFTNDNDLSDIPPPFEDILVYDALLLMTGYLTDVSEKSIMVWRDMRDKLDDALQHAVFDPQGVGAEPRYVRYTDDVDMPFGPTVNW